VFTQRDAKAEPVPAVGRGSGFEADADLRDFENVPLTEDVEAYFEREVKPHVPDAWMDRSKDKVGYEINFNRTSTPSRRPCSAQVVLGFASGWHPRNFSAHFWRNSAA
jgi:putative transposon-encoded protein